MKKWLSILASVGLVTLTFSPLVSCVTNENVDESISTDIFRNSVETNSESNNSLKQVNFQDQPFKWYAPKNTEDGSLNAWANDPCTILYDNQQKLYYSWMLFRNGKDFPAEWVEMTSPDMNSWTQTEIRIKRGREFSQTSYVPSTLGGSVWRDDKGQFFDKGDIVFVISMQPCRLMDGSEITGDRGIAYYVSHGLGQPIYKTGVLTPEGQGDTSDWRDTFVYQTDDGLYFAIASDIYIEFWKINSFKTDDIKKVDSLYIRGIGVEVPNVIRFGENEWYISCSVQDAHKNGPFQSCYWYLCHLVDGKFEVYAQGQHEYGPEGYAQRVSDPYQRRIATEAFSRAMAANWNYNTDIWEWKGGCYGTDLLAFNEYKYRVGLVPNDRFTDYYDNGTAVYIMKGKDLTKGYKLSFNKGDITFYLEADKFFWNNQIDTGLKKWTEQGGQTDLEDVICMIWNKTTLTVYNITKGWNAHFMLPQKTTHTLNEGAKSLALDDDVKNNSTNIYSYLV